MFRSSDTYVTQLRSWLPDEVGGVLWFGAGAAHSTVYVPLFAGAQYSPDVLSRGWQGVYDPSTSYWASRLLLNVAQIKFSYIVEDIRALQQTAEAASQILVDELTDAYVAGKESMAGISDKVAANAVFAASSSADLLHSVLFKYADGYLNVWRPSGFKSVSIGLSCFRVEYYHEEIINFLLFDIL